MTNIISDVAGNYKSLLKLIDKMPDGELIFLGDLIDRGPRSKEVIEFVMNHDNARCVLANHEHMMINHCRGGDYYANNVWLWNGGSETVNSFGGHRKFISKDIISWTMSLPKYIEVGNALLSHSFIAPHLTLEEACDLGTSIDGGASEDSILWNRSEPIRRDQWELQICGHNSQYGLRSWEDGNGKFAMCLDDSRKKVLTGLHLETMEVFQQEVAE